MTITMELYELKTLCANMAALGVATYQKEAAPAATLFLNVRRIVNSKR